MRGGGRKSLATEGVEVVFILVHGKGETRDADDASCSTLSSLALVATARAPNSPKSS